MGNSIVNGPKMPAVKFREYTKFSFLGKLYNYDVNTTAKRFPFVGYKEYSKVIDPIIKEFYFEEFKFLHDLKPKDRKKVSGYYKKIKTAEGIKYELNNDTEKVKKKIWDLFRGTSAIASYSHLLPYLLPDKKFSKPIKDKFIYIYKHYINDTSLVSFYSEFYVKDDGYRQERTIKDFPDNTTVLTDEVKLSKGNPVVDSISLPLKGERGDLVYLFIMSKFPLSAKRIQDLRDDIKNKRCHRAKKILLIGNKDCYLEKQNIKFGSFEKTIARIKKQISPLCRAYKSLHKLLIKRILVSSLDKNDCMPYYDYEDLYYNDPEESGANHIVYLTDYLDLTLELKKQFDFRAKAIDDYYQLKEGKSHKNTTGVSKSELKLLHDIIQGVTKVENCDEQEVVKLKKKLRACLAKSGRNYSYQDWYKTSYMWWLKYFKKKLEFSGVALVSAVDTNEFASLQYDYQLSHKEVSSSGYADAEYFTKLINTTGDIVLALLQCEAGKHCLQKMSILSSENQDKILLIDKSSVFDIFAKVKKVLNTTKSYDLTTIVNVCIDKGDWFTPILLIQSPIKKICSGFSAVFSAFVATMPRIEYYKIKHILAEQKIKIKQAEVTDSGKVIKPGNLDKVYEQAKSFGKKILKRNGNYTKVAELNGSHITFKVEGRKPVYLVTTTATEKNMNNFDYASKALDVFCFGLEIWNLYTAYKDLDMNQDKRLLSAVNINLNGAIFDTVSSMAGLICKLSLRQSMVINIISSTFDLYVSNTKVADSYAKNDYDALAYNSIASASAVASIGTSFWIIGTTIFSSTTSGLVSGSAGGPKGAIIGFAVGAALGIIQGVASYLADVVSDTELESWAKHCYWGKNFDDKTTVQEQITEFYRLVYSPEWEPVNTYEEINFRKYRILGFNIIPGGLNNSSIFSITANISSNEKSYPLIGGSPLPLIYDPDDSNCDSEVEEIKKNGTTVGGSVKRIKVRWISNKKKLAYYLPRPSLDELIKDFTNYGERFIDYRIKVYMDVCGDGRYVFDKPFHVRIK